MKAKINDRITIINKGEAPKGYRVYKNIILPNEWNIVKLEEIIEKLDSGVSVNSEDRPCKESEFGILKTSCANNGRFYPKENKVIIAKEIERAKLNPRKGMLIISRMNTPDLVGEVGYVDKDYNHLFIPDRLWQTCFSEDVDSKWLVSLMTTFKIRKKIKNIATGTSNSMKNISKGEFLSIEIPKPPLPEQQKIANILSTWDKAIELKEQHIEEKKRQKKGLMKKLLTGEVRMPGFDGEWKEVRLKDIFLRVTRKNDEGNTNVLTISAQRGLINQEDYFNKSVASAVLDNYFLLKKGEFAYNKSYSNGYPMGAIKRLNIFKSGVVTTLYICFRLIEKSLDNASFYENYFESGLLIEPLRQIAHEGGRAHGLLNVTPKDFFELKIMRPPFEEQCKVAEILTNANKEVELLEKELEALKIQKKGLMQLLLTGIIRVNL